MPFFVFAVLALTDNNLKLFNNTIYSLNINHNQLARLGNFSVLPSYDVYVGLISAGLVSLALAFGMLIIFFYAPKQLLKYKWGQIAAQSSFTIIVIFIFLISGFLTIGVAEYYYSWFTAWVNSLKSAGSTNVLAVIQQLMISSQDKQQLTNLCNQLIKNFNFQWLSTIYVWLFVGFQLMIVGFSTGRTLCKILYVDSSQFALKGQIKKPVEASKNYNLSYVRLKWHKWFTNDYRNLSIFMLLGLGLLLAFPLTYIFFILLPNTNLHKFLEFNFIYPNLFPNPNWFKTPAVANVFFNNASSGGQITFWFAEITILLMWFVLTASALLLWVAVHYSRSWLLNQTAFKQNFFLKLVLLTIICQLLLLASFATSQILLSQAFDKWNNNSALQGITPDLFGKSTIVPWLRSSQLYASIAIIFGFYCTFSTVSLIALKRLIKAEPK